MAYSWWLSYPYNYIFSGRNSRESLLNNSTCPSNPNDSGYGKSTYGAICGETSVINFDREKDAAFCVGVDKLFHRDFVGREERIQEETIASDAESIAIAFKLDDSKVKVSIASKDRDHCTKQGLRASFISIAKMVGNDGNFIFYFAGHGFEFGNRCVLAPSDFADGKEATGISGDDLVQWLNEAACSAKNVIFIFDCCYAGNIGESLTKDRELKTSASLFAICGCAPGEIISSIGALGHSIFTYFLLDHLKTTKLNIKEAIDDISEFCICLSSLVWMYDYKEGKPYCGTFEPTLFLDDTLGIIERIIPPTSEKEVVVSLRKLLPEIVLEQINDKAMAWLCGSAVKQALQKLGDKAFYCDKLQTGIASVLLHSLAILHYAHENEHGKSLLKSKNLFLVMAIDVSKKMMFCDLTIDQIKKGLQHYIYAVEQFKLDSSQLHTLYTDVDNLRDN